MYVTAVSVDVTVHSYLWYDEIISDIQGMGCSELGKNTIFNEHPVPLSFTVCMVSLDIATSYYRVFIKYCIFS